MTSLSPLVAEQPRGYGDGRRGSIYHYIGSPAEADRCKQENTAQQHNNCALSHLSLLLL